MAISQINVYASSGNLGTAAMPVSVAKVALIPGQALMLDSTGALVPNNGSKPVAAWAPVGGAVAGQSFTPQSVTDVNEHPTGGLTPGNDYYIQPNGTTDITKTVFYAGTAISTTALVYDPSKAASDSTLAALAPYTLGSPFNTADRKIITESQSKSYKTVPLTLLNGFTATSADAFVGVNWISIGIANLNHPSGTPLGNTKLADIPKGISVATAPLFRIDKANNTESNLVGFASASEVYMNTQIINPGITTIASNFFRIDSVLWDTI
jgi:hypothetical protein